MLFSLSYVGPVLMVCGVEQNFIEASPGFGIVDGLTFLREHRLNHRSFKNFPAPTVRLYFNDRHITGQRFILHYVVVKR